MLCPTFKGLLSESISSELHTPFPQQARWHCKQLVNQIRRPLTIADRNQSQICLRIADLVRTFCSAGQGGVTKSSPPLTPSPGMLLPNAEISFRLLYVSVITTAVVQRSVTQLQLRSLHAENCSAHYALQCCLQHAGPRTGSGHDLGISKHDKVTCKELTAGFVVGAPH